MRTSRWARRSAGMSLCAAMVLPAVVAIALLAGRRWFPVQDLAITDLRVRDVWSVHVPLTGMYSRYGWDHPGPLMFWSIGLVSGLTGRAPWATRVGAAALQGLALGALGWVAWRRGLRILLAAASVTALTFLAVGGWLLRQPWNPHVALPFFVLFVFLAWTVATGSLRNLIGTSLVGSFLVQTHVGYLPFVVVGAAWALWLVRRDHRRGATLPAGWRRTAWIAGLVSAVAWIPPVVETLVDPPGNFARIARFFALGRSHPIGLRRGAGFMAAEFRIVPPWLGGSGRLQVFTGQSVPAGLGWLLVPCGLLLLGYLGARATGSRDDARLVGLAALLFVTGLLAMSRITGAAEDYLFLWRAVVAAFIVVACVWSVAAALAPHVPSVARVLGVAAVAIVVAWGSIHLTIAVRSTGATTLTRLEPAMQRIAGQLHRRPPPREVVVGFVGTAGGGLYSGLVDELARDGVAVHVRENPGRAFGTQRSYHRGDHGERWYVTEQGSYLGELLALPGARVLASSSPLTRAEDAELLRLQGELASQLDAARRPELRAYLDAGLVGFILDKVPGIDHAALTRVGELNEKVDRTHLCRCAVVKVDSTAPNPSSR